MLRIDVPFMLMSVGVNMEAEENDQSPSAKSSGDRRRAAAISLVNSPLHRIRIEVVFQRNMPHKIERHGARLYSFATKNFLRTLLPSPPAFRPKPTPQATHISSRISSPSVIVLTLIKLGRLCLKELVALIARTVIPLQAPPLTSQSRSSHLDAAPQTEFIRLHPTLQLHISHFTYTMTDVQVRPTRGRASYRGRGGHSYRGGRNSKPTDENSAPESFDDQGEIGELKKKYATKVPMIKEMFPDWTTEDIVFTLDEANGDETAAIERISEGVSLPLSLSFHKLPADILLGTATQWGEVKKKHADRSKSKVKEAASGTGEASTTSTRGRGRGGTETRGRGRGDRGRGRGGRTVSQANDTRSADKTTKTNGDSWGEATPVPDTSSSWDTAANGEGTVPAEPAKEEPSVQTPKPAQPKPAAWSSLFAKPPPQPKAAPQTAQPPAAPAEETVTEAAIEPPAELVATEVETPAAEETTQPESEPINDPTLTLTPSKDELTETNLEQVPDVSHPPDTATAASTVASTIDPHSQLTSAVPNVRPGLSGYAASAIKATSGTPRSASFQRRILEQQEAVVMPGDRAVDRAAVQFGSMGLNGQAEDLDTEEEREEPETRAQPPNDSPVAPRASLPPAPAQVQQQQAPPATAHTQPSEPLTVTRPAPGLPPVPQQQQQSPNQSSAYADYGRGYGQGAQKFDPFGQQAAPAQPQSQDSFSGSQTQQQPPTTSAPTDYSSFYGANQQRDAYNNYYGNFAQGQEAQQRSGSAFGTSAAEGQQSQYKYAQEAPSSGNQTPNPTAQVPQQQAGQQPPHNQNAPSGYPGAYGYGGYPSNYGYPYNQYGMHHGHNQHHNQQSHQYGRNRPMFDDARRYEDGFSSQQQQYAYGGGYGGSSYGKGMYAGPQHQYSYEHSASPANTVSFAPSSMSARDSGYRTGSAQPSEAQQSTSSFGMDPFGRGQSGFGGQPQSLGQQSTGEDASKPGPSPSLGQVNRPESASNSQQGTQSSGFPHPQSQHGHQAFGGYPQYGGLGGFGGHQGGQNNSGYGSYGAGQQGFGGGYGYNNNNRNQWGQYGGH